MKVGIGVPITIPGAPPEQVLEWARRAEQADADEPILFSASPDPVQVDLLAGAAL